MIELKELWIRPCSLGDVREFVQKHHYSASVQGITPFMCFEVVLKSNIQKQVGALIFGIPGQVQTEKKWGEFKDKQFERPTYIVVELRRLVLIEEVPTNGETWVLSRALQKLSNLGIDRILSYADPNQIRPDHPDGKHTGLIYRAYGFHKISEAGKTKAIVMQKDFTEAGKTFKKGRRLPIRNLDQYQNFRVRDISELDPQVRHDWEIAKRKKPSRATNWQERKTGRIVYVIKEPAYLTSLSVRLRNALTTKAAEYVKEDGKILYVKDFRKGMPYYDTPTTVEEK